LRMVIAIVFAILCNGEETLVSEHSSMPYCKADIDHNFEHVIGTWKPIEMDHRLFTCCGNRRTVDEQMPPMCVLERGQATNGFIYPPSLQPQNHCCTCQADLNSEDAPLDAEKFAWVPDTCRLASFMEGDYDFCEMLGDRRILMLGDSTMPHVSYTLNAMIYTAFKAGKLKTNCSPQIHAFMRHVWRSSSRENKLNRTNGGDDLLDFFGNEDPADIFIVSIGAHMTESPYFDKDAVEDKPHANYVKAWKQHIKVMEWLMEQATAARKKATPDRAPPQLLYMTAQPGFHNCLNMTQPLTERITEDDPKYHYQSLHTMNEYASVHFKGTNVRVINTAPLELRPDAKVKLHDNHGLDCLHTCVPGPLNFVAELIGHVLLTQS
jgi:hypothetical protein